MLMTCFEELGMAYAEQALIKSRMRKIESHYLTLQNNEKDPKRKIAYSMFSLLDLTYVALGSRSKELQRIKIKALNKAKKEIKLSGLAVINNSELIK